MRARQWGWQASLIWVVAGLGCDVPVEAPDASAVTDGGDTTDAATALDAGVGDDLGTSTDAARRDTGGRDRTTGRDAGPSDRNPPDTGGQQGVELNPGWISGACTGSSGCDDVTLTSPTCETTGFPGGFCTQACAQSTTTGRWICPDRAEALDTITRCIDANGSARCVAECDFALSPTGCRPGYTCVLRQRYADPSVFAVCLPSSTQTWPGETAPASDIGTACDLPTDCHSLACISWPNGYCTKTMCEYAGCPAGSSCFSYGSGTACLKDCAGSGVCRESEGYSCDDQIDACWMQPTGDCQPLDTNAPANPFNRFVLAAVNDAVTWPRDGTYPFCLGSGSCGPYGFIHDGVYLGQTVFEGGGDCMCTGHTLEIFLDAWRRYRAANTSAPAQLADLTLTQLDHGSFYQQWQGTASAPQANLASAGLAFELVNAGIHIGNSASELETVQPGDFINLSRDPPSGHSVVFIGWIRNDSNAIVGLRYYGCQPANWEPDQCADPSDLANTTVAGAPSFMSEGFYDVYGSGGVIRSGIYGLQIGRAVVP